MRVMIISTYEGQVSEAAKMALSRGAKVVCVDSLNKALDLLRKGQGADVLFVDLYHDIDLLISSLANERINVPIVACGINADPESAARAIRAGAREYIPFPPEAEIIAAILESIATPPQEQRMICRDPMMTRTLQMVDRIAPSEANVLITGESGTGKEVMAAYIHQRSKRAHQSFVCLNCAAIPENLLESELFGHEKGAFTGAIARRIGKFEEANGGTLLLDEISEMHIRLQAKLLRAIQEKVIDRVGGERPIKVDIRIIATSNRNLLESCRRGEFREDLFYRLNVVNLEIPPLRSRPKDIEILAEHFVKKYATLNQVPVRTLSTQSMEALLAHPWEGNVRQLENTIHRSVLLAQGKEISVQDLFDGQEGSSAKMMQVSSTLERQLLIGRTISAVERDHILGTLEHCKGNRTHAANILGISIRTLRNKLKEYMIESGSTLPLEPAAETIHSADKLKVAG